LYLILTDHFNSHAARRAGNDTERGFLTMSMTCLRVTLPTFSLFGVLEPAVIPAAFFKRIEAGGDLVMNVNDLS